MRMNTSIPMMGQQADIVGSAARGFEAGRKNRLADIYNQHGAGIASGDQNALNALAQFDPTAAMQAQRGHQVMQHADAQEGRLNRQEQRMIEAEAAKLSAADRAAQLAQIEQGVAMGMATKTPQEWDALMSQYAPELVGQFENRQMHANRFLSVAEVLKGMEPAGPQSSLGKIQADIEAGHLPEGTPLRAGQQSRTVYDANGNVVYQEGGDPEVPKLTVDAAKNSGFLIRTEESNAVLNELEEQGLNFGQQNAEALPLGLGNYLRDENFQKFDQARRDFVNAILRRESGAVISDQEFDNANKQYFPVPGDSPEVIKQKRRNRETAIQGLRVGSGEGAAYVDRLKASEQGEEDTTPDFGAMTDDELQKWISENE